MIYEINEDSDFLMHHGIKGQKWGVENGPPYPLNKKEYSALEKKMAGIEKTATTVQGMATSIKSGYKNSYGRRGSTNELNDKLEYQAQFEHKFYNTVKDANNYINKLKNSRLYGDNKDAQKIFKQYEQSIEKICKETSTLPKAFYDQGISRRRQTNKGYLLFGVPGMAITASKTNGNLTKMFNDPKLMAEWDKYINS